MRTIRLEIHIGVPRNDKADCREVGTEKPRHGTCHFLASFVIRVEEINDSRMLHILRVHLRSHFENSLKFIPRSQKDRNRSLCSIAIFREVEPKFQNSEGTKFREIANHL